MRSSRLEIPPFHYSEDGITTTTPTTEDIKLTPEQWTELVRAASAKLLESFDRGRGEEIILRIGARYGIPVDDLRFTEKQKFSPEGDLLFCQVNSNALANGCFIYMNKASSPALFLIPASGKPKAFYIQPSKASTLLRVSTTEDSRFKLEEIYRWQD